MAIASGKGGVGKTWLAIALAHAMAGEGRRVLLFDGDLGLANVDIQLGLSPAGDLGAVLAGRMTLAQAVAPHEGGFDILAGRSGNGSLASLDPGTLDHLLTGLRAASAQYDVTLLDLGAGLDRGVRRMAAFADRLVVVVTDEPTSLTDAYAVLKLYAQDGGGESVWVVVNQAETRAAGERTFQALARASTRFLARAPHLAGVIRRDAKVREAIRRQCLIASRHPNATACLDVRHVAEALLSECVRTGR
jgi:flagellar biosynthesis protein FlhG